MKSTVSGVFKDLNTHHLLVQNGTKKKRVIWVKSYLRILWYYQCSSFSPYICYVFFCWHLISPQSLLIGFQNPSWLGFQKSSLFVFPNPSLLGFPNPSLLGFQILLCLDFSILLWISKVFFAGISKDFFVWISNLSLLGF